MFVLKHLARGLDHSGHTSVIAYLGTEETRASTALCYPEVGSQLLAESTRLRIPEQSSVRIYHNVNVTFHWC